MDKTTRFDKLLAQGQYKAALLERTLSGGDSKVVPLDVRDLLTENARKFLDQQVHSTVVEYEKDGHRKLALVQYFSKVTTIDRVDEIRASVARVIQRLFDAGMIFLGFLMTPHLLPLDSGKYAVLFYVPASPSMNDRRYDKDRLNEFLGNVAFMNEAEIGNEDWTNL